MTPSHQACQELEQLPTFNDGNTYVETSGIFLAYMGGCSVVQKARNAQNAGASMIILINNDDRDIENVLLEDDGSGKDIHIPIGLISYNDGRRIESYMSSRPLERVMIEVNFKQIQMKEEVDFKFFFSSSELKAYELIGNMTQYLDQFGSHVKFTPVYVSHISPYYNVEEPRRELNCISRGKFCYYPKETTIIQDGQRILLESLRQKCMFLKNNEGSNINYYYRYLKRFYNDCLSNRIARFNERCAKGTLENMGYDINYLDDCIADSFGVSNLLSSNYLDNDNRIFEKEYQEILTYSLTTFPAVVIDGKPLDGLVNENNIITTICNKLMDKPEFCRFLTGVTDEHVSVQSKRKSVVYVLIFVLLLVNVAIFFVCRKYIIQRVQEKIDFSHIDIDGRINNVINNYMTLQKNQEMDYKAFDTDTSNNKKRTPIEGSVSTI